MNLKVVYIQVVEVHTCLGSVNDKPQMIAGVMIIHAHDVCYTCSVTPIVWYPCSLAHGQTVDPRPLCLSYVISV